MKKLFLFAACLVFIISSFLLVANAAEPAFGTLSGEGYKDTIPQCHIFGAESNGSLTHRDGWFNESCAKVLLTYTVNGVERTETYPAYYILENDSTLIWNFSRLEACLEETHGADVELSIESVVQIQIPYGITVIPERAFVDSSRWDGTISEEHPYGHATESDTLTYVYMPNTVLEICDFAFAHCTGLDRFDANDAAATGDHNHQMLQSIGYRAFHGCPLTSFIFNNHLVSLGEGCFEGCSIKEINLSRCSELKEIPARAFHEAEENSTSIILSNSIERIGDHAFTGVHASMIFLGTSLKSIGEGAFDCDRIDMLFIPVTVVEVTETSFSLGSQNVKTYIIGAYTSEEASALTETLKNCDGKIGKLDVVKLIDRTQTYFSNNPNSCDSFGGHVVDHNSAVTSVSYPNGIGHAGTATGTCGVCLQDAGTVSLTPIIVAKGYSVCMFGTAFAFSNGYEVYHDALAVYESVYGDCELGIVFVLNDRYNGSDMRNNIASLGVCMDETMLLSNGQASMDFIMTYKKGVNEKPSGSDTTYGDLAVVISAYLLHKEDKAEGMQGTSHYVQDTDDLCTVKLPDGNGGVTNGKTSDDKYYIVSYNSIHGMIQSLGLN